MSVGEADHLDLNAIAQDLELAELAPAGGLPERAVRSWSDAGHAVQQTIGEAQRTAEGGN